MGHDSRITTNHWIICAWAVFRKDLQVELRTRYALGAVLLFAVTTHLLLRVTGDRSQAVKLLNTNTKAAKKAVELGPKTAKKAVVVAER